MNKNKPLLNENENQSILNTTENKPLLQKSHSGRRAAAFFLAAVLAVSAALPTFAASTPEPVFAAATPEAAPAASTPKTAFASTTPEAAYASASPASRGAGYTAVLYDNTNGLPTSDANAVVQTEEGFLWIGSYSGLLRYDGNEFYRYDSSTGMSSVVSLFADSKGRLWVGTNDSGVFVLENGEFTSYDREEGLRSSSVRSILEDKNGNILIATTTGMAYVDPDGVMHDFDDPQINREYICELVADANDVVYGLTLSGAFFTIEDLRLTAFYDAESLGYGVINTVYPDPENEGWLYLGTQNATIIHGDLSKNMEDSEIIPVDPQQMVRCIRQIDGLLWVCADTGIGFLSDDGTYTPLTDLPMTNSVEHVIQDFEGNLWFTSSRQGLMKIVRNRFTDLSEMASLPPLVVNSTCRRDGLLYLGTDTGLTILDDNYTVVENDLTELLDDVRIRSIHMDSAGRLWLGTNSAYGLICYDADSGTWDIYNTDNGLASNRARTMKELSDGRIAVATNAGVNIIEDGEITALYNDDQGISNLEILCLEESPDGKLYAGSDGDGIYVIDHGKVSRIGRDNGLRSEVILRMRRDPVDTDLYWIITSNSIAWMKDGVVTPIQNFPYANNFDLFSDGLGRIWVLSSNGIYVVRRDELLADEQIRYTLYDTKSGLPCAPTANAFSFLDADGTLYIAAANGVSSVDINDATDNEGEVRLAVPFLTVDDKYVQTNGSTVTIPADCKRLTIYAYAFSYSLNNYPLRYTLEGFDDDATELTQHDLSPLTYTNLPGGTYHFRLSVLNTITEKEAQTLDITIVKEKTLMEQTWFWVVLILLGALLAALIVYLYFRRKTRLLLAKQKENQELIDEMSEVFASCIDLKDPYTNGHSHRVAKYSALLAKHLGKNEDEVNQIYHIALLHDIGKISIPDSILNKPGRLTDEEFQIMRDHSIRGYEILKEIRIAPELAIGAGYHHERIDGRGYPRGLKGDEIPEIAQIIAVADTFDAMYSTRPYRRQVPIEKVAAEIRRCAGTQLNADVVDALMELIDEGAFEDAKETPEEAAGKPE